MDLDGAGTVCSLQIHTSDACHGHVAIICSTNINSSISRGAVLSLLSALDTSSPVSRYFWAALLSLCVQSALELKPQIRTDTFPLTCSMVIHSHCLHIYSNGLCSIRWCSKGIDAAPSNSAILEMNAMMTILALMRAIHANLRALSFGYQIGGIILVLLVTPPKLAQRHLKLGLPLQKLLPRLAHSNHGTVPSATTPLCALNLISHTLHIAIPMHCLDSIKVRHRRCG